MEISGMLRLFPDFSSTRKECPPHGKQRDIQRGIDRGGRRSAARRAATHNKASRPSKVRAV